ncbi:hypothetical protein GGI35DRAFT_351669 [Trichoderma velutinum]
MDNRMLQMRIQMAVNKYFVENTSYEEKQKLLRRIENRPTFRDADPIIPPKEVESRLKLITEIQRFYDGSTCNIQRSDDGRFQFTALQMSYLLLIPMEHLRSIGETPMVPYLPYLKLDTYVSFMARGRMPDDIFVDRGTASQTSLNWIIHIPCLQAVR